MELSLSNDEFSTLPADLLAGKKATEITINCPTSTYKLKIDADAFKTSKDRSGGTLTISGCDLSELNFDFLDGFDELLAIQFTSCNFISNNFNRFPQLKKFGVLIFENCTGLETIKSSDFPNLGHGLYAMALSATDLDDNSINNILDWVSSLDNLQFINGTNHKLSILTINKNRLTYVPEQIKRFQYLEQFYLTENLAELTLGAGSLSFYNKTIPVSYVDLGSSQIALIEEGAFGGNTI